MKTSPVKKFLAVLGSLLLCAYIVTLVVLLYNYTEKPRTTSLMMKETYHEFSTSVISTGDADDPGAYTVHTGSSFSQGPSPYEKLYRDPLVTLKGNGQDQVTVMIYMNGSNLESEYGCATTDIKEMLSADLDDKVSVVIQTMGTRK